MKPAMIYRPLTAAPFRHSAAYQEIEPCRILRPYVRCFWSGEYKGYDAETEAHSEIVVPDTCVDIIYRVDYTDNTVIARFNGVNDRSFYAYSTEKAGHETGLFAIRFYAWSAYVFSEDSLAGTMNGNYDARERFDWLDRALRNRLAEPGKLADKIQFMEQLLMRKLETARRKEAVDRTINTILSHYGTLEISGLAKENYVGVRQLERLFQEYIGITPKKLSNLVRYQFLWNDVVRQCNFDIQNAVYQYGFTDVAHLMREFRRYHTMNIRAARKAAFQFLPEQPVPMSEIYKIF